MQQSVQIPDESALAAFAAAMQTTLPARATIVLSGTLGAGKTRFVQAFAEAAGIDRSIVTSPTFVLCQHYKGHRQIHHLDAYRMKTADEFVELGGFELQEDDAITFIEWGERIEEALVDDRITLHFAISGPTSRQITITSDCQAFDAVLKTAVEQHTSARRTDI